MLNSLPQCEDEFVFDLNSIWVSRGFQSELDDFASAGTSKEMSVTTY